MSQNKKLEQVLELLLSEDTDQAAELLHQFIVEKARTIYESIVEDEGEEGEDEDGLTEADDEVGGEPNKDFTAAISSDVDEIETDEQNDGEAESDEDEDEDEEGDDHHDDVGGNEALEDKVSDLESELEELRAQFQALVADEMEEPYHKDLEDKLDDAKVDSDVEEIEYDEAAAMYEKKKHPKMEVAKQTKKMPKGKKVEEETQFLKKTGDTGQRGTAKMVGTGKDSPLGAEQQKSVFSKAPAKPNYGGTTDNILGSKETGGEYGKFNAGTGTDDTPSDNVDVSPKKEHDAGEKTEGKFVGTGKGSQSGKTGVDSPLTKAPSKLMPGRG